MKRMTIHLLLTLSTLVLAGPFTSGTVEYKSD